MSDEDLLQIEWRLINMMVERGIRTATELRKRLIKLDVDISSQQMGRFINQFPDRMNTKYLRGVLTVLDCDISDLIRVLPAGQGVGVKNNNEVHPVKKEKRNVVKRKDNPKKNTRKVSPILPPGFDK